MKEPHPGDLPPQQPGKNPPSKSEDQSRNWAEVPPEKVRGLQFPDFEGRSIREVFLYIMNEFPDRNKYEFPGHDYEEYLFRNQKEHPEIIPEAMKSGWPQFYVSFIAIQEEIFPNSPPLNSFVNSYWTGKGLERSRFSTIDKGLGSPTWLSDWYVVAIEK